MRETQFMGLPEGAWDWLREKVQRTPAIVCPHCGKVVTSTMNTEVYDSAKHLGMFDDGPELHRYFLEDGTTVEEKVQAAPWSSGPCIFLQLNKGEEVLFEWTEEAMKEAI